MVLEPAYDLVIVDEAHHLKKQTTQAYQLVSQLKKKYVLFLTATPVENDLEELFNLITSFARRLETPVCPLCGRPSPRLLPDGENRLVCVRHGA